METDRYTIDENGVLTVKPGVTCIGQDEFRDFDTITKVVLPRTICVINHGAFHGCKHLRSINIPLGVRIIESWVFADCESLTEIDIPEGVRRIGSDTFHNCKRLKKVNLPSTLEKIEDDAFEDCKALKQIVVPDGAEMVCKRLIGHVWTPFTHCDALEKVIIRDVKPRVSKTEIKKVVLLPKSEYHSKGRLYGAIIGLEPGEEVIEYAREVVKDLLWESFKGSGPYLDYEDYSFQDMPPVSTVLEYDKRRLAIVDMPKGASPKTVQIDTRTYLTDEEFYKTLIAGRDIEWIPLVKQ